MKNRPELIVLLVAVLAMAAKIYCAFTTCGTVDVVFFYRYAHNLATEGLINTYLHISTFNHPPLMGNYLGFAYELAGGKPAMFAFYNRLPAILADFGAILALLWIRRLTGRPPFWAIGLLAASPVSFMISGYHGNFDPIIALGLLLTAIACLQDRTLLSGVLLGIVCQLKIIPLIMSPVLFFFWWHRGKSKAWTFTAATILTLLIGWSAPLLAVPKTFLHNVLIYNSVWGWWGFTYLLSVSGIKTFSGVAGMVALVPLTPAQELVTQTLKFLVIGGTLTLAWRRRKGTAEDLLATMALVWSVFYTFAPGFGVQYLAWISPFLLFYSTRWFLAFLGSASVGLFVFYNSISDGMPWMKGYALSREYGLWGPWLLLPWSVFVVLTFMAYRQFGIGSTPKQAEPKAEIQTELFPSEATSS